MKLFVSKNRLGIVPSLQNLNFQRSAPPKRKYRTPNLTRATIRKKETLNSNMQSSLAETFKTNMLLMILIFYSCHFLVRVTLVLMSFGRTVTRSASSVFARLVRTRCTVLVGCRHGGKRLYSPAAASVNRTETQKVCWYSRVRFRDPS